MHQCSPEKPCVFVVEDDHDTRVALRDTLEEYGYGVCSAADGTSAISMLQSQCLYPQVIVLDVSMPLMNGTEFFKRIRKDEALKDIPVVVMSAYANAGTIPDAEAFMAKPLNLPEMLSTIQKLIPIK